LCNPEILTFRLQEQGAINFSTTATRATSTSRITTVQNAILRQRHLLLKRRDATYENGTYPFRFQLLCSKYSCCASLVTNEANTIRTHRADGCFRMWRFSDISGTDTSPHLQGIAGGLVEPVLPLNI